MENVTSNSQAATADQAQDSDLPVSPNALSALGYFCGLVAIAALFMKQYEKDANVRFHAFQALLFQFTWVGAYICLAITTMILTSVASVLFGYLKLYALLGIFLMIPTTLSLLFSLGMLGTWVALIVAASQGKKFRLPVLGGIAERAAKKK